MGEDPDEVVHKLPLWDHEKTHVENFVRYVKKASAFVEAEGALCVPDDCDAERKMYIQEMVAAYRFENYHFDALLHSWDYPESKLAEWKNVAQMRLEQSENHKAEAELHRMKYQQCTSRIRLAYYQNESDKRRGL